MYVCMYVCVCIIRAPESGSVRSDGVFRHYAARSGYQPIFQRHLHYRRADSAGIFTYMCVYVSLSTFVLYVCMYIGMFVYTVCMYVCR